MSREAPSVSTISDQRKPRAFQKQAIEKLQRPVHLICSAPTGSGKSLIFERRLQDSNDRAILISPLIALARQQNLKLLRLGIPSQLGAGPKGEPPPERGKGVWVISPEKLFAPRKDSAMDQLRQWDPNFLIVDECHCLWEWGREFRPAFGEVPKLLEELQIQKSLWLTATLPPQARAFLRENLPHPRFEMGSFDLPKRLTLRIQPCSWRERFFFLSQWLSFQTAPGIIFVGTRKSALRNYRLLKEAGFNCRYYHAGMSSEEKKIIEKQVEQQKIQIIIATSAFGMGMDYRHLQWVVLFQAPPSLLALAQSIGRVGRSGANGQALVLWEETDFRLLEWLLRGEDAEQKREDLHAVWEFLRTPRCRLVQLQDYFSPQADTELIPCARCDVCLNVNTSTSLASP